MPPGGKKEDFFDDLNEEDRAKIVVLVRSFASAKDLETFIDMTQQVHKEQEHRKWAWGVIKTVAGGIVLLSTAWVAIRQGMSGGWFK